MRRSTLAAAFLIALCSPAAAQIYTTTIEYCGGQLVATSFETRVEPGSPPGHGYFATFQARGRAERVVQIQITGHVINRLVGAQRISSSGTTLRLGTRPGGAPPPLRGEALAAAVRVSCQD